LRFLPWRAQLRLRLMFVWTPRFDGAKEVVLRAARGDEHRCTARRRPAEESHPSQPGCKQAPIWGTPIFVVLPLSLPTSVRLAFERNEALRQTTVDEMRQRAPEGDLPPSRAPLTPDVTASSDEIAPSFRPEAKAHPACYHAQEVP
jgi:hypothetical protein